MISRDEIEPLRKQIRDGNGQVILQAGLAERLVDQIESTEFWTGWVYPEGASATEIQN